MEFDSARVNNQAVQTAFKQPSPLGGLVELSVDINQPRDAAERTWYVDVERTARVDLGVHRREVCASGCPLGLESLSARGEFLFPDQSILHQLEQRLRPGVEALQLSVQLRSALDQRLDLGRELRLGGLRKPRHPPDFDF